MNRLAPHRLAVLATIACVTLTLPGSLGSCRRVATESETAHAAAAAEAEADPRFEPPDLERLTEAATSPFRHSPVSWRYTNSRIVDGEPPVELTVGLTTTRDRYLVEGVGLLFKAVVEVGGPDVPPEYRSFVFLLTPEGLFMSEPNSFEGDLAASAHELVEGLRALGPSWPLPGQAGCESRVRDAALPFANVRGIETDCENLLTPTGHADVTTLWVDGVGFVFRQAVSGGADGHPRIVRRDVLAEGDLVELSPPSISSNPPPIAPF